MKRPIIEIDRDLCNGCGLCTTACAEGALELDSEGKARLVREIFCDGLGACLNVCPTGALTVVERESASYDENAAIAHVRATRGEEAVQAVHRAEAHPAPHVHAVAAASGHRGCPGSQARSFAPASAVRNSQALSPQGQNESSSALSPAASELSQWPIQLHLVSPAAPYFRECDLLVAASCTAFALGSFHADLLRGKTLAIACPKLDRTEGYIEKLAQIIANNTIYSLTVAIMEVPCCTGLSRIVSEAVAASGKAIAVRTVVVGIDGQRK